MTQTLKRLFLAAFIAAASLGTVGAHAPGAWAQNPAPAPPGPTSPLTIVSSNGAHAFQVELADTPQKSELGLMYRKEMAKDHGMIFDFGEPKETTMWMKNTFIPLDMVFFDSQGKVLTIVENARPQSLRLIDPGMPVKGVIELNGGLAKELGLKPGDMVRHKIFDKGAEKPPSAKAVSPPAKGSKGGKTPAAAHGG